MTILPDVGRRKRFNDAYIEAIIITILAFIVPLDDALGHCHDSCDYASRAILCNYDEYTLSGRRRKRASAHGRYADIKAQTSQPHFH